MKIAPFRLTWLLVAFLALGSSTLSAEGLVTLLKDIRAGASDTTPSSWPGCFVEHNGLSYFIAHHETGGFEIWKSDGTTAGTSLAVDVRPGRTSLFVPLASPGAPCLLRSAGGLLYFTGWAEFTGHADIWRSDGTPLGTYRIAEAGSTLNLNPLEFVESGGLVYFGTVVNGNPGWTSALWATDGTTVGTTRVKEFFISSWWPEGYVDVNGTLFFPVFSPGFGYELWKSDGTTAGTVLVKNIAVSGDLVEFGGLVYFTADDGMTGKELWKSNGTTLGTVQVVDLIPGAGSSTPTYLTAAGAKLYFTAVDPAGGGFEPFVSDGTALGTVRLKDVNPGGSGSNADHYIDVGGTVFFSADDGTNGVELWKTDGTDPGTVLVKDITPGAASSFPHGMTALGNGLFAIAGGGAPGAQDVWESDGTTAGTVLHADLQTSTSGLTQIGGHVYFGGSDGVNGTELWITDGTTPITIDLRDDDVDSNVWRPLAAGGSMYFFADDDTVGRELWQTDGTPGGTRLVKDINPGSADSMPFTFDHLYDLNGGLVFFADDGSSGREPWGTDGTLPGTVRIKDIAVGGTGSSSGVGGSVLDGLLYFGANDGVAGYELWRTDGTTVGTVQVKDIQAGAGGSDPRMLTQLGGMLLLAADDGSTGRELWISDGTGSGTSLLKDIDPVGDGMSNDTEFFEFEGASYFVADDGSSGTELWKTDGTTTNTARLADIHPSAGSDPVIMGATASALFFSADDGSNGRELWKTDGTGPGTQLVKDIFSGTDPSGVGSVFNTSLQMASINGDAIFAADDGINGRELWKSDGTGAGTVLLKDILPGSLPPIGPKSSAPELKAVIGGQALFIADDDISGRELWRTDGTASGTTLLKDIATGPASAFVPPETAYDSQPFQSLGGKVYFFAADNTGLNPWVTDGTTQGTYRVGNVSPGAASMGWFDPDNPGVGYHGPEFFELGTEYLMFVATDLESGEELWSINVLGPGAVPDGGMTAGTQLTVDRAAGTDLSLNWGSSCGAADVDYAVYEGQIGNFQTHEEIECTTLGATNAIVSPAGASNYYLIVPHVGSLEGSYGFGDGTERLQSLSSCHPQAPDRSCSVP